VLVSGARVTNRDRAKDWCVTAFALNCLLVLAQDLLPVESTLWLIVRGAVGVAFTVALILWIVFAYREGVLQSWTVPAIMAIAVAGGLLLLAAPVE
jgi:hypothetical protein